VQAAGLVFELQRTQIDWVNVIQVGSTQLVAGPQPPAVLGQSDLGLAYSHVKFNVSGKVCDLNYRLKDGDAVFLEVGTPIYHGQPPFGWRPDSTGRSLLTGLRR
jgi:hypothetical protein